MNAPLTPGNKIDKMTGKYDGKELQRNPGITEDRFEAYKLPSIVNGKRVYPRGHDAQKK
jgi:hypothetical protein